MIETEKERLKIKKEKREKRKNRDEERKELNIVRRQKKRISAMFSLCEETI